jgi:protein-disulfide isomerase
LTRKLLLAAAALALSVSAVLPRSALAFDAKEKTDIEAVVRDYLIRNPEVLLEAMDALQAKRNAEDQAAQGGAIASAGADLFASPTGTVLGNPEGDVTIVEFFDYNCGYCKHALGDMETLIDSDKKLRVVLKEIPVLGEASVAASHVSLAFRHLAPTHYGEFHKKLLGSKGTADADTAIAVAADLGVEEKALREAMGLPEVEAVLADNEKLAGLLKINGTPSYVIGNEIVPGAIGAEGLAAKIANVRGCGKTVC